MSLNQLNLIDILLLNISMNTNDHFKSAIKFKVKNKHADYKYHIAIKTALVVLEFSNIKQKIHYTERICNTKT